MAVRLTALTGALLSLTLGVLQPVQAETVLERVSRTGRLNTVVLNGNTLTPPSRAMATWALAWSLPRRSRKK